MRTKQEQKLEDALFTLIKNAGKMLNVNFYSQHEAIRESRGGQKIVSSATKEHNAVSLVLVEPTNPAELNEWADAIVKAEELVDMVLSERLHEYQNPNYFKSICAKYYDLKHNPNNYAN